MKRKRTLAQGSEGLLSGAAVKHKWNHFHSQNSAGRRAPHFDEAIKYIKPGQTVIDVGGGFGNVHREIKQKLGPKGRLVNLDASDDILASYKRRGRFIGYDMEAVNSILPQSPIRPNSADHVIAVEAMQFMPDEALVEMINMAKPGGQIHFSFATKGTYINPPKMMRTFDPQDVTGHLQNIGVPKANFDIKPVFWARDIPIGDVRDKFMESHPQITREEVDNHPDFQKFRDQELVHWVRIKKPKGWKPKQ